MPGPVRAPKHHLGYPGVPWAVLGAEEGWEALTESGGNFGVWSFHVVQLRGKYDWPKLD